MQSSAAEFSLINYETMKQIKPDAPHSAALYDRRGQTLNSWGRYGHNIKAGYSSEFGLWLNSWQA